VAVFLLSLHYFFVIGGLHVITNHESVQPSVAQTTYHHTYQIELAGKAFAARPTRQLQIPGRTAQKGKTQKVENKVFQALFANYRVFN